MPIHREPSPITWAWYSGSVSNDLILATAILDRLLHHSYIVNIRGTVTDFERR
ncbi:ATP-binding protein [Brevibacillus marinus]|uniref:ATP-binding protein n=1 Tax=Brevibacillus marinus TaxID=2496837 RepID=UPI003B96F34E